MRELILSEIDFMKNESKNFYNNYRWVNIKLDNLHISQIKFEDLSDKDLLTLYKRILNQLYKMM